jgi:hypothetical protein
VFKNHESCPEIMKNRQKIFNKKSSDIHIARNHEKPSKSIKKIIRFSHCPEIMKNRQSV